MTLTQENPKLEMKLSGWQGSQSPRVTGNGGKRPGLTARDHRTWYRGQFLKLGSKFLRIGNDTLIWKTWNSSLIVENNFFSGKHRVMKGFSLLCGTFLPFLRVLNCFPVCVPNHLQCILTLVSPSLCSPEIRFLIHILLSQK